MTSFLSRVVRPAPEISPWDNPEPIREALFSVERLEEHARSLAIAQLVTPKRTRGNRLATRLAANEAVLLKAYRSMSQAVDDGHAITPAAEWLIDNYHLVERQIRSIRSALPSGYYQQLPKLAHGPLIGYPRVFGVAWAFVAHTDSRFDPEMLCRFLTAYQEEQPLTIGELWAVAITLRIVLVENLRRVAEQILDNRVARQEADDVADRLLGTATRAAEPLAAVLAGYENKTLPHAFAVELVHRLRDRDPRITPLLTWLDQRLAAQGTNIDQIVRDAHQRQGAATVTVRNIITSMRLVSDVDWSELFERTSPVDAVLAAGSDFSEMDFSTRNLYRNAIETLGRRSYLTEIEIAHAAVAAAAQATEIRAGDPGYHLFADGRRAFESAVHFRPKWGRRASRLKDWFGIGLYVAAAIVVGAILVALPLTALADLRLPGTWLGLLAILGILPAIDAAVALVNRGMTEGFGATLLPAMALREGVPTDLRTMVVVPTLLTNAEAIGEQVERLEIHHLASPQGDLYYALLSDWRDAATEYADGDEALLASAAAGIARLNRRYGPAPGGGDRFRLLHRKRVWNESERSWLGWERKRGKLHELNRFLRGATDTNFLSVGGHKPVAPGDVRYVITLDADTRLPRDTVRRLIGKMAHRLNRPRFDPALGRVVEGYAVLQPRVTPSLPVGREGSLFQWVFANLSGIDPYDSAVSDVYQDLFGEGSYAGKGIYDIDAFEAALAGRVPDSTLLSHDLFEGVFARAGLASDIEVVEDFPARYDAAARRHHRWARGDWQLLPWILGLSKSRVPAIGRWKMLDNLRRTLSAPAGVAALLAGWALPFDAALIWTSFIVATIILPAAIPVVSNLVASPAGITWGSRLAALAADLRLAFAQSGLAITFLAHQAWLMSDAILRTLIRLAITRRHLLEWVPAADVAAGLGFELSGFYRRMGGALVLAVLAIGVPLLLRHEDLALAAPFAALWILSPAIARWSSRSPALDAGKIVSEPDANRLRLTARQTWRFFETFVTAEDHRLPPDNFQEDPAEIVAHRTSPTNIGLYFIATATAHDFGWLGTNEAVERLEATFATLADLEHFRGHLYNWYGTLDLRPLDPKYVSSVDSGNLAGHLLALSSACREWAGAPPAPARRLAGIADALDLARREAERLQHGPRTQTVPWHQLDEAFAGVTACLHNPLPEPAADAELASRLEALAGQAELLADIAHAVTTERGVGAGADMLFWIETLHRTIESHRRDLAQTPGERAALRDRLTALETTARQAALAMEFGFLLDPERRLLSIGYLVAEGTLDPNCYDLLASEARLASFVAIAKGDIPARHWFRLGRAVTPIAHGAALISWSGSMFEYLMPSLVMRAPGGSLLEQTSRLIVRRQIDYAKSLGIPWGISESAYNTRDLEFTYQYSNFGVPGLGLKRGLSDNAVIAPYATALAAMVDPHAAAQNLERFESVGALGRYGFYEALDYTPGRVPEGETVAIVKAFMAHHQGMTIVAIADALLGGEMRTRFHAEPIVQAAELLLQERPPRDIAVVRPWAAEGKAQARILEAEASGARRITTPHGSTPATHLLSNGRYSLMLTAAGSGYSRWRDLAVTRWREDATCDDRGTYIYLRDAYNGAVWSAGFQPTGVEPDRYEVTFSEDRAEFSRRDGTLTTTMEVLVSAEDDAEVRRISLSNIGTTVRDIDVTSYAELVLAPQAADIAHPVFSNLFVQTEHLPELGCLLATRRRRTPSEPEIWAAHFAVIDGDPGRKLQYETDRARFVGRCHDVRQPIAVIDGRPLSDTAGIVLDPIFSLRHRLRIGPGATTRIAFWTVVAATREAALDLIDKHRDKMAFERAGTLAWTQAQVQLHHLGIDRAEASLFQRLACHLLHAAPTMRPLSDTIARGAGAQPGLWKLSLSGDLPIVLLRVADIEDLDIVRQALRAHDYWTMKQFAVDLVIVNERASSYVQDLQIALENLVRASQARPGLGAETLPGRIFVLRSDLMGADTRGLLAAVARVVLVGQRGRLADQLDHAPEPRTPGRAPPKRMPPRLGPLVATSLPVPVLEFFNGLGGFADGGRQYVTVLGPGQATPAPWINVIANPQFGFHVATEGSGYTWSVNSREHQLTPWCNDPVTDRSGEAFYLRDHDTGELWSPTATPIRDPAATYVARHGRGFSRFEHVARGIATDLLQYVPLADPIKISRLTIRNLSDRVRHLSVTAYVEWVLGPSRGASAPFVVTEIDPVTGAMLATNRWNAAFETRVAFVDMARRQTDWTGDRREFIGRNGRLSSPAALTDGAPLSGTVGAGLDPCGALRTTIELPENGSTEIVVFLGEAADLDQARNLIRWFRRADLDGVLADVGGHWNDVLSAVQVRTPDRAMDIMLNGWLLYQTLACRVWARAAFYQASGAYGFRDQLQDGMALTAALPAATREHLLRAAARQFVEGDVQHWWLPHSGQGVRTRISDDRAWLGYAVAHYIAATGDRAVLDENLPFLEGPKLEAGEHDSFFYPTISDQTAPLFEHCARALDHSLEVGSHGLPLMGTGDWNDGMNRIGEQGRGESVWLGWLLHATLIAWAPIADARGQTSRATVWRAHADALRTALEQHAWDGDWYKRAWFDDGTPVGSAASEECRIDSISQSWAVISGAADPDRAARAMSAVERELIRKPEKLALLFTPPFDRTPLDPGYIKGYPPGIRENGGQYTHAALWSVIALAELGRGNEAVALFSLLNPINHARSRADVHRYKVEPYVIAADIYAMPPHVGRGGWTWYTGSAGWTQRAGIESLLGVVVEGETLRLNPCIPEAWPGFEVTLRHRSATYEIMVENAGGGVLDEPLIVKLVDDGGTHRIKVQLKGKHGGDEPSPPSPPSVLGSA